MSVFGQFAAEYMRSLHELVAATSDTPLSALPAVLKSPGTAVAYSDSTDRHVLEVMSKGRIRGIVIDGKTLELPQSAKHNRVGFLQCGGADPIERFLYPGIPDGELKPHLEIAVENWVFRSLAFSTKEYNAKYWDNLGLAVFCGDFNVPFVVTKTGSFMGLDLLHGFELEDVRHEKFVELILVFGGSNMIPRSKSEIQDWTFNSFAAIVTNNNAIPKLSFTSFLDSLKTPVHQNVLMLGPFKGSGSEKSFEELKAALETFGFHGFTLMDSSDVASQSNREKLICGITACCFVVVLDTEPSGHIAEIEALLTACNFKPVIVVRQGQTPSTAYLEDRIEMNDLFRIANVSVISAQELRSHIKWAKDKVASRISTLNKINNWREIADE